MKLGEPRSTKRQLRSTELVLHQEERVETTQKKLALKTVKLLRAHPEKIWTVRLEPGQVLASLAFPELVRDLSKNLTIQKSTLVDLLLKNESEKNLQADTYLNGLAILKILGTQLVVAPPNPKHILELLSSKETMGEIGQIDIVRQAALMSWLFPELQGDISAAAKIHEEEVFKNVDQENLHPNGESPSTGAYFRLINPGATARLQEIAKRRVVSWEEQTTNELNQETVAKYTNRSFNFTVNRALLVAGGLEILLAQEATITPEGKLNIISAGAPFTSAAPLPDRNLSTL